MNPAPPEGRSAQDEREAKIILDLRKEADGLKDCLTRYSFQGMSIAVAGMIFIFRYQHEFPLLGVAALLPILLLLAICSMGTHKYASVNRILGYELHLERTRNLRPGSNAPWAHRWRLAGWEEAMRAWRIVATTIIEHLCVVAPSSKWGRMVWSAEVWDRLPLGLLGKFVRSLRPVRRFLLPLVWRVHTDKVWGTVVAPPESLYKESRDLVLRDVEQAQRIPVPSSGRWFEPPTLVGPFGAYHAGGYLKTITNAVYVLIGLALAQILASILFVIRAAKRTPEQPGSDALSIPDAFHVALESHDAWVVSAFFLVALLVVYVRARQISARRRSLEDGVLSIHSCAIMWQAALAAHFRALPTADDGSIGSFHGYTSRLGALAAEYIPHLGHLNRFLDGTCRDNTCTDGVAQTS